MQQGQQNTLQRIRKNYTSLTDSERSVADFFLNAPDRKDLSAQKVASTLFVSGASLTRFAKKCGYTGYREFIFQYLQETDEVGAPPQTDLSIRRILSAYQKLLDKTAALIDRNQIERICSLFTQKKRICIYGIGSSGLAATELYLRLLRLGLNVSSFTDAHLMKMNSVVLNDTCLVLGFSISGRTPELLKSLEAAKRAHASTILATSHKTAGHTAFCDETIAIAGPENLSSGRTISPQLPLLFLSDVIYAIFLLSDTRHKELMHEYTLDIIQDGQ